jgi:L-methionine (R)-S-oxide reductase
MSYPGFLASINYSRDRRPCQFSLATSKIFPLPHHPHHAVPFPPSACPIPLFNPTNSAQNKLMTTHTNIKPTDLIPELDRLALNATSPQSLMTQIVALLHGKLTRYNWVGFYMLEKGTEPPVLVLGAFEGTMTPHTRIPLNQGICGAAASSGKTIVVDNVANDSRYLSCSIETKSEIVVPIYAHGAVIGEIDIDSHNFAAFTNTDRAFLEEAARIVGSYVEEHT